MIHDLSWVQVPTVNVVEESKNLIKSKYTGWASRTTNIDVAGKNFSIVNYQHYCNGVLENSDGVPASITVRDGVVTHVAYFINGLLHNASGPSIISSDYERLHFSKFGKDITDEVTNYMTSGSYDEDSEFMSFIIGMVEVKKDDD